MTELLKSLVASVTVKKFEVKQRSMNEIFLEVCKK